MSVLCTVASSMPVGLGCLPGRHIRRMTVRATQDDGVIYYGGSLYTEAEWKEAFETGHFKTPPPISGEEVLPSGEVPTIRSVMAFDGAPELINARLAMVGFLAALGAELASGEGVVMQLLDAPGAVLVTYSLILAATLVPLFKGTEPESRRLGPFTANAELLNGRAAMIGLLFLTLSEHFTGGKALL